MLRDAPNLNYLFAGLVVEELIRSGAEWFVVCPGSRSAPLAWAIASHPRAKTIVHHDERGAAFHALGLAKGSGKPAVFVCTSGSAVANALPAVVEAFHGGVPLILLTADRPPRLQGTGANQTIQQEGIYGEFVRREENFIADDPLNIGQILISIDDACMIATGEWPGPVHINCMMDEPLAPVPHSGDDRRWARALDGFGEWLSSPAPFSPLRLPPMMPRDFEAQDFVRAMAGANRGLVVLGQLNRDELAPARRIIEKLRWPVLPDVTSHYRLRGDSPLVASHGLPAADRLVAGADVIIHLGGPLTSRRLLDPLASFRGELIRVSPADGGLDPNRNVTVRLSITAAVFAGLIEQTASGPGSADALRAIERLNAETARVLAAAFPAPDALHEAAVAHVLSSVWSWPGGLFLGNSMPIRDTDLFGAARADGPWIAANRGASGIDGNIATAAGIARATGLPMAAVIGDLAALHDLNSLALLRDLKTPFTLIVINNDGGGIFSMLPIAQHPEHFEKFFTTPHGLEFDSAAKMYGLPYHQPKTNGEFAQSLLHCAEVKGPSLIEVRTNREENARIRRELDAKICAALEKI